MLNAYTLTEAHKMANIYDKLSAMTENNDHTAAYIAGCDYLINAHGADELTFIRGQLSGIRAEQSRLGHLRENTRTRRNNYHREMLSVASGILPPFEYGKFYMCF